MKKIVISLLLLVFGLFMVELFSNSNGAPINSTGAPGENTCAKSGCHTGTAVVDTPGWVNVLVPLAGFKPDSTYTVDLQVSETGISEFGFQITAEDVSGNKVGSWTAGAGAQVLGSDWVTHTSPATTNDNASWNLEWQAPSSFVGDVTFYAAFNATNDNNLSTGDHIYTSSLTISQDSTVSARLPVLYDVLTFYNADTKTIHFVDKNYRNTNSVISILDINGKIVGEYQTSKLYQYSINVSDYPTGLYFVNLGYDEWKNPSLKKIIIH